MFDLIGFIADVIGIVGAFFAVFAWIQARRTNMRLDKEEARLNELIHVELSTGANTLRVPVSIRRAEFTRAELMGRIGMLSGSPRFDLAYVKSERFFRRFDEILQGSGTQTLTISCSEEEFEQFKLTK